MRTIGIIAEYDPFHKGHAWQIAQARAAAGEDAAVVCVMSGSWTQRGSCALTDKWTRAALAVKGGADLVLELPLTSAVSSAEGFARGGVRALEATGVVDTLSFGSESGDLEALRGMAEIMEGDAYRQALRAELDKGISFASARQRAVQSCLEDRAAVLKGPNDNLAVEYLRSMGPEMTPLPVLRRGAGHHGQAASDGFASATMVREAARRGDWAKVRAWTPEGTAEVLESAGIADMALGERAILARLRSMNEAEFAALPDSGAAEGLPARLVRAARDAESLEQFYDLAKTKRYAHARIRRLALWAFLGLSREDKGDKLSYLRVLASDRRGLEVLRRMKTTAKCPVLTKTAHIERLDAEAQARFKLECKATDLYGLLFEEVLLGGLDLLRGPVLL